MKRKRGYFGIGIYNHKFGVNVGTLWRSSFILGASFIFTIGKKYKSQAMDTTKAIRHIPLFYFDTIEDLKKSMPKEAKLVGIEMTEDAIDIKNYKHPQQAIYLLGTEDVGLPDDVLEMCDDVIKLPGDISLNVSVAGSIVLFDRINKLS